VCAEIIRIVCVFVGTESFGDFSNFEPSLALKIQCPLRFRDVYPPYTTPEMRKNGFAEKDSSWNFQIFKFSDESPKSKVSACNPFLIQNWDLLWHSWAVSTKPS